MLAEPPLAALTRRLSAGEQERRALDWLESDTRRLVRLLLWRSS
jgi:hypothetical protein